VLTGLATFRLVGKPEVIDGPRGQVPISRITGHLKYYITSQVSALIGHFAEIKPYQAR